MKPNKISALAAGAVFLLTAGLLAGCGDEPEEAQKQSEEMLSEPAPVAETTIEPMAGMEEPVSELSDTEGMESIDGLGAKEPDSDMDIFDTLSETTDEALDTTTEKMGQSADTIQDTTDEIIERAQGLMDETETAASSAIDEVTDATQAQAPVDDAMSSAEEMELALADDANEVVMPTPEIIRDVQQGLRDVGFNPGPIDGITGPRTQAALENFQKQNNLAVGQLTKETLRALEVNF